MPAQVAKRTNSCPAESVTVVGVATMEGDIPRSQSRIVVAVAVEGVLHSLRPMDMERMVDSCSCWRADSLLQFLEN